MRSSYEGADQASVGCLIIVVSFFGTEMMVKVAMVLPDNAMKAEGGFDNNHDTSSAESARNDPSSAAAGNDSLLRFCGTIGRLCCSRQPC